MVARARTAAIAARDFMIASSRLVSLSKQALRESIWLANELLILCKLDGPESLFVGFVQFCTAGLSLELFCGVVEDLFGDFIKLVIGDGRGNARVLYM